MAFLDGNSCSYSCNSEKTKKPVAYVNPKYLAAQQQKAAATEAWTGLGISLFLGLTGRVTQGIENGDFKSSSGVEVESLTEDEIEGYIDATLKEIKIDDNTSCSTISEAETVLANKELTLQQAKTNLPNLKKESETRRSEYNIAVTRNGKIPGKIAQLEASKSVEGITPEQIAQIDRQIKILREEEKTNKGIIEKDDEIKKLEADYKKALQITENYPAEITALKKKVDNLHKYEKQLKQLEADRTLANYQHKNSENITDILKNLKTAQKNGNEDNVKKYTTELKNALQEYVNSGDTTNTTLNNLAKMYQIEANKK